MLCPVTIGLKPRTLQTVIRINLPRSVDDLSDIVNIQIQPNEVIEGITIVLKKGGIFSGDVVDEEGNPARAVSIGVEDSSGRW